MTIEVSIRFYEELNDFLPPERRKKSFTYEVSQPGSIKDLIESLGVPHTEIDLILANSQSVDFSYLVQNNDQISVYPVFEALDISPIVKLRPQPLRISRFVLDSHLGRLAAYLRMLGFDTLYRNDYDDETLANISVNEHRTLLTCDVQLLMRKIITHGYYVRERNPKNQLLEVLSRFDLFTTQRPFTRCMHCNGEIKPVQKDLIEHRLMPRTRESYEDFWQCVSCRKIYWKGSHFKRMQQIIKELKDSTVKRQ